jgi:pimeloyl-ACP methyl ester carboxylesterase
MASLKLLKPFSATWAAIAVMLSTVGCTPPRPQANAEQTQAMRQRLVLPDASGASGASGAARGSLSYLMSNTQAAAEGNDRPRLILVHGTPGSAQAWTDYLVNPPAGVEVVALDRPGFGQSEPQGAQVSLAAQAQAVAALLAPAPRQNILLGHSLGGPIVAWLAAQQPQRVAAVVLVAASLDPAQEKIHPLQRLGEWPLIRSLLSRSLRNANRELLALEPQLQALQPMLAQITAPTYILHGDQDSLVPVANVPFMQTNLSRASALKTTLLPGRNHFLPWNSQPEMREAIAWALTQAMQSTARGNAEGKP